jgi:hypothetical protein
VADGLAGPSDTPEQQGEPIIDIEPSAKVRTGLIRSVCVAARTP